MEAKKAIARQMKAIWALVAASLSEEMAVPRMAVKNWQQSIPRAPQMSRGRRPNLSMVQKEMGVDKTLTRVVIRPIRKGFEMEPCFC